MARSYLIPALFWLPIGLVIPIPDHTHGLAALVGRLNSSFHTHPASPASSLLVVQYEHDWHRTKAMPTSWLSEVQRIRSAGIFVRVSTVSGLQWCSRTADVKKRQGAFLLPLLSSYRTHHTEAQPVHTSYLARNGPLIPHTWKRRV